MRNLNPSEDNRQKHQIKAISSITLIGRSFFIYFVYYTQMTHVNNIRVIGKLTNDECQDA